MKIALIDGSPKIKESASECLLNELKNIIKNNYETTMFRVGVNKLDENMIEKLLNYDVWIFAFPTYYAAIPSHVLKLMELLKNEISERAKGRNIYVYGLVNCGFYFGIENKITLEMLQNWCNRSGLVWRQGIGFGGGGIISILPKISFLGFLKKNLIKALKELEANIEKCKKGENLYIEPNMPCLVYNEASKIVWKIKIKKNGLNVNELGAKCK